MEEKSKDGDMEEITMSNFFIKPVIYLILALFGFGIMLPIIIGYINYGLDSVVNILIATEKFI